MSSSPSPFGLSEQQAEEVVRLTGVEPSLHNRHPWRFRVVPRATELHSDPQRRLPAADSDDGRLRLGCGAALFNLRLTLGYAGVRPVVTLLPRRAEPKVVRSGGRARESQDQWELRGFSGGAGRPRTPGKDCEYDPLLLVLCPYHESRLADLQAGQAMQRMLPTATSLGLVASLISQVVEID